MVDFFTVSYSAFSGFFISESAVNENGASGAGNCATGGGPIRPGGGGGPNMPDGGPGGPGGPGGGGPIIGGPDGGGPIIGGPGGTLIFGGVGAVGAGPLVGGTFMPLGKYALNTGTRF